MASHRGEEDELRTTALRNAGAILAARQRAEDELVRAKEELEARTQELSYSLSLMQATFESTADGILVTDNDGRVLALNEKFLSIWGLPRQAVEAGRHRDLVRLVAGQFQDPVALGQRIDALYSTPPAEALDTLALADGRVFERYSRPQYVGGEMVGRVWSYRDVSARKQAEDAARDEALVLDLLNRTGAAIASTLDLAQLLQIVSDAATRLSGAEVGGLVFDATNGRDEAIVRYTVFADTGDAEEQIRRLTAVVPPEGGAGDGSVRLADLSGTALGDGPASGADPLPALRSYMAVPVTSRHGARVGRLVFGHSKAAQFTDRTERLVVGIAAQASIAIDNSRLYEESRRIAIERERLVEIERAARADIVRTSRLKDEFLATLSHELRTPLTAILGWGKVLLLKKNDPDTLERGLETINRNAVAQARLIDDLLDMHRIISGKVRLDVQPIALAKVVDAAIEAVRPGAEAKEIRLRAAVDPLVGPVSGDPNRLQQVLWNLLTNAVKFTPRGGRVDVVLVQVDSHLELRVSDSGVGIAADFLPSVFDRFRQADSSATRSQGGLGLGLSIVKQLVELHGGRVHAQSAGPGQGATFIVDLPLTAPRRESDPEQTGSADTLAATAGEGIDLAGLRLLVIDDESDARELIEHVLRECRAEVHLASSATEGLSQLRRVRPDALLCDIGMPGRDGYELIRDVRRLGPEHGGRTPAIALTAFARTEDRIRAMLAGYQVHMSKPIEPRELLATVASLVGRMHDDS